MQQPSAAESEDRSKSTDGNISARAKDTYNKWNKLFAIKSGDTFWLKVAKVTIRIIILLLLVALSPLILFGLLFALLAAL